MVINENSDLELSHAIEFHRQGNSSAALKVYQALLERDSTNPDLLHFYGVFCFQFGDQGQGIQLVESCLKLNPQYPDACNNLGNMYKLQGKWEEAQAQYERVLALRPEFSDAMINLGVLARSRQDYNQALQWYKRAIEANPKDGLAYDNLSRLYLKLGHKRSALEVLDAAVQEAVREESSREDMHLRRAYLMMVLGHTEQGQQIYEDWLKAYPESKRAQHM
nr:tetratricopeptide repeat protein [Granulosicoccus sp.]